MVPQLEAAMNVEDWKNKYTRMKLERDMLALNRENIDVLTVWHKDECVGVYWPETPSLTQNINYPRDYSPNEHSV
jgi:hypothetical protein